jgi:pyruvate/2-oxoacid:ferredoxin oxidoreductase alpha subunit
MVLLDAFFLSHTSEPVEIPSQELVDGFIGRREAALKLDTSAPHAFNALVRPDDYMDMRLDQQQAMRMAEGVLQRIDAEWANLTGRSYGALETYREDDADLLLVTSGTITSTAREVVDERRAQGERIGLVKFRMFRPFPTDTLRQVLRGIRRVAVLDRNVSPGHGGIFAEEIRSALYDLPLDDRPQLFGYVLGLGGRDVTPAVIHDVIDRAQASKAPEREDLWVGVKS